MTQREQLDCVLDEIRAYPQPVADGDAQYCALLQRKAELEESILLDDEEDGDPDE